MPCKVTVTCIELPYIVVIWNFLVSSAHSTCLIVCWCKFTHIHILCMYMDHINCMRQYLQCQNWSCCYMWPCVEMVKKPEHLERSVMFSKAIREGYNAFFCIRLWNKSYDNLYYICIILLDLECTISVEVMLYFIKHMYHLSYMSYCIKLRTT